ncbi:MAG: guanylate kinase [Pseudomonadales bacterium]|nr:guanylate kinase [Pseudomonadales bacterium]NRA17446.1 guanylate kinase [Oceanospirillaceae bacterium]
MIATGTLYIISAPSGAGKTSLVKAVLAGDNQVRVSVSDTTRAKREGESDGVDYNFVTMATFDRQIEENVYLEYADVFTNKYGTSKNWVDAQLAAGVDVILEIDWQGAQQVRNFVKDAISIFILPPSQLELRSRLQGRGTDEQAVVDHRMENSVGEIEHYTEFDYLVINDNFDVALQELLCIFKAKRLRLAQQQLRHQQLLIDLLVK